ncbi:hypothetical protein [Pseudonocardia sp. TMWB2A]|uniref:hypothetical protein n=1 Tax=Pseudonocardia sp. TMWB2A TaxID=687430 RepID=UPI00307CF51C
MELRSRHCNESRHVLEHPLRDSLAQRDVLLQVVGQSVQITAEGDIIAVDHRAPRTDHPERMVPVDRDCGPVDALGDDVPGPVCHPESLDTGEQRPA